MFAATGVGLASGVGCVGVAVVMTISFGFAAVTTSGVGHGADPIETAKLASRLAELDGLPPDSSGSSSVRDIDRLLPLRAELGRRRLRQSTRRLSVSAL